MAVKQDFFFRRQAGPNAPATHRPNFGGIVRAGTASIGARSARAFGPGGSQGPGSPIPAAAAGG